MEQVKANVLDFVGMADLAPEDLLRLQRFFRAAYELSLHLEQDRIQEATSGEDELDFFALGGTTPF